MTLWSYLVTFSKRIYGTPQPSVYSLLSRLVPRYQAKRAAVIAAAIAVTSIRSKNQPADELPKSNKKLKNRLCTSIEAKYV